MYHEIIHIHILRIAHDQGRSVSLKCDKRCLKVVFFNEIWYEQEI